MSVTPLQKTPRSKFPGRVGQAGRDSGAHRQSAGQQSARPCIVVLMPPALKRRMSALMAETTVEMLGDSGITWVGIVSYVVALYALSVYVAFLVNPPAGTMTILGVSFHSFFPFGIDLPNAEPILCPYGHHISYGCNWWRGLVNLILFLQLVCIHALLHISSVQKDYLPLGNLQRSAYCLVGGVQLIAFCAMWQSDVTGIMLWEGVEWLNWPYYVCVAIFVSATFVDDHFALFGIKQSTGLDVYEKLGVPSNTGLGARWHRRFVRHPMITCLVLMHMLTPSMSFEHLMLIFWLLLCAPDLGARDPSRRYREECSLRRVHRRGRHLRARATLYSDGVHAGGAANNDGDIAVQASYFGTNHARDADHSVHHGLKSP
jgi:hypothetical protein